MCELGLVSVPAVVRRLTGCARSTSATTGSSVPDLSALTPLEILYLHDNALTALPALPPSLTYLNVSENPLPACRGRVAGADRAPRAGPGTDRARRRASALRELHLRHNAFTSVPECVRSLRELRLLDMRSNHLTSIPDWLVELPRLEKLDLRWNEVYDRRQRLRRARLRRARRLEAAAAAVLALMAVRLGRHRGGATLGRVLVVALAPDLRLGLPFGARGAPLRGRQPQLTQAHERLVSSEHAPTIRSSPRGE